MIPFQQTDFSGGINLRDTPDMLAENEYVYGINLRARDKQLTPVQAPVEDTAVPDGVKQGLYAFGSYLLLFAGGRAYWKLATSASWTQIIGFQMSATAQTFYVALVTGSSINFRRYRTDASANVAYMTTGAQLATANGTPAGLLVQDGINQPWIIFSDLTSRVTQTYAQWELGTAQEYVPIGTQMIVVGAKLYVLALNGRDIYQSVSGRMLDFVVNVQTNGTAGGDATTTSIAVSGDTIKALKATSLTTFAVATARTIWLVELDYDRKLWGEPTYRNNPIAEAGATNQHSIIEILGDYMFIDVDGIRSLNAVMNLKFKGQNSPFSARIGRLFVTRSQSVEDTCAVTFNNYAIFSVFTQMGHALVVYDTILGQWVSIDQHNCIRVKNFAVTEVNGIRSLWGLTITGRLFQLEASATSLQPVMLTRGFTQEALKTEQQAKNLTVQVNNNAGGTLRVIPYCDFKRYVVKSRTLTATTPALHFPIEFPIEFATTDRVNNVGIPLVNLPYCSIFQISATWSGGGNLSGIYCDTQSDESEVNQKQKANYASSTSNP